MNIWKTLKIFISSTFKDLELERDLLTNTFESIKKNIFDRRLTLIPYDLRWRERHEEEDLVKWCLKMVGQCQYFVGILGYRYGWRPPHDVDGKANNLSITEMEINYSLKHIPREKRFFCFGNIEQYSNTIHSETAEDLASLESLKQRLRDEGETIFEYQNIHQALDIIVNHLQKIIDVEYPANEKVDFHQLTQQEIFNDWIDEKRNGFVGRSDSLKILENFAMGSDAKNYCIVGAVAGTGKSALLSQFYWQWQQQPRKKILAHFLSLGGENREINGVMRSIGEQLKSVGFEMEKDASPAQIRKKVQRFLEEYREPLVMVMDGIDEVDDAGRNLQWLPQNLHANIRVIITTRLVDTWEILKKLPQAQTHELSPLTTEGIRSIIAWYQQMKNIHLSNEDVAILCKRAAGNPLYLKVALDEVVSSGIAVGQLALSVEALFTQILERLQKKYNREVIQQYLGMIAASRNGITEEELWEILSRKAQITDDFLLSVQNALDNFIVRRSGVLSFFHAEFERNIKQSLGKQDMRSMHQTIAKYLRDKGWGYTRTLADLPFHLQWSEQFSPLLELVTNIAFLQAKSSEGMTYSIVEDFSRLLTQPEVMLPDMKITMANDIAISRKTITLLLHALELDLQFIQRHPQLLFQCLWNRCYWHDVPKAKDYHKTIVDSEVVAPWESEDDEKLYRLAEYWQQQMSGKNVWVESLRPVEPSLDSPLISTLKGHEGWVRSIAFHPHNTEQIASASGDNTAKVWDITTRQCLFTMDHRDWVNSVQFSKNGQQIFTACRDRMIHVFNSRNGEKLFQLSGHNNSVQDIAVYGDTLVSVSKDHSVRMWKISTRECLKILEKHKTSIRCVVFHPSGEMFASGAKDGNICVWSKEGECLWTLKGHTKEVRGLSFHPTQNYLASSSGDATIRIWDLATGDNKHTIRDHKRDIRSITYNSNGTKLFSASKDQTLRCFDTKTNKCLGVFTGHEGELRCVICGDKGRIASAAMDRTIRIWNSEVNPLPFTLVTHNDFIRNLDINRDGEKIASCSRDNDVRIWDVKSGLCIHTLQGHCDNVSDVAFAHNDNRLVSGSHDKTLKLWDIEKEQQIFSLEGHEDFIRDFVWTTDDKYIVSVSRDATVRVWEAATGECVNILREHQSYLQCISCSHDNNYIASGARDGVSKVWKRNESGYSTQSLYTLEGHRSGVTSLAFHPNNMQLASASDDNTVRIWNMLTGECEQILEGHSGYVIEVAYSKDGSKIITVSWDRTTRVWDTGTGKTVHVKPGYAKAESIAKENLIHVINNGLEMVVEKDNAVVGYFGEGLNHTMVRNNLFFGGVGTGNVYILRVHGINEI
ncbi:DUF4062 domain-containing protein [Candidatus Uabimicrobium amorphum]|uniref:DUF4062 domain-containing protein n=1 Tax=Uabimicrobium amorphum TaxID=2596890 RepID=A0A5S9IV16_UABAM|nr:DUF4062 domain-containing protein [Candidatus Uabimicrobium amorphum]BBM88277.1 hypothetical protein UABAM_06698 [Candidatus Uabimicrobium amorphum]